MLGVIDPLNLPLTVKQNLKPLRLFHIRDGIDHGQRRCVGPSRVFEAEHAIVFHLGQKVHGLDEIVRRMNERFRTVEQFEMQIDTICLDIAMAMKGTISGWTAWSALTFRRSSKVGK